MLNLFSPVMCPHSSRIRGPESTGLKTENVFHEVLAVGRKEVEHLTVTPVISAEETTRYSIRGAFRNIPAS
jgi:hypothetical protein